MFGVIAGEVVATGVEGAVVTGLSGMWLSQYTAGSLVPGKGAMASVTIPVGSSNALKFVGKAGSELEASACTGEVPCASGETCAV